VLDGGSDQAQGLREAAGAGLPALIACPLDASHPAQWVAQLALGLRLRGRRPIVLDASGGLVASSLGLRLQGELLDLLQGERQFDQVAQATADGVWAMRGERGIEFFVASGLRTQRLLEAFAKLSHGFDDVLLAMPVDELASMAPPGAHVPVVGVDGGYRGLVGAYGVVKRLAGRFGYRRFMCLAHGAASAQQALGDCARVARVARQHVRAELELVLAGVIPAPGCGDAASLQRAAQGVLDCAAGAS